MSDEKNFLQTIKLEISRNFRLEPYERKAFHRILGLVKSQQGKDILLRELEKGGDIRKSAIGVLGFLSRKPSVNVAFLSFALEACSEFLYNSLRESGEPFS